MAAIISVSSSKQYLASKGLKLVTWVDFVIQQWPLITVLAVLVAAFLVLESRKGGRTISFHEATRLLNSESAVVVDVRESAEFGKGHIVDALNLPYAKLKDRATELENHKAKQIIVVDKMGQHAGASGKILRDLGFDVVRLQGGITEWSGQNLPLVKT